MMGARTSFDVDAVRAQFPILGELVNGKPLAYLDNAATTQKPEAVIDAIVSYYRTSNANISRGVHTLGQRATKGYESVRVRLAEFVGAHPSEVVFTKGNTESINLVAETWGRLQVGAGDRILVSVMEHHANLLPWQRVAREKGATLVPIPLTREGRIDGEAYRSLLDEKVKLVAFSHVSNALGTVNPVEDMTRLAHSVGAKVMIDGAQALGHGRLNFRELQADFYALAAHKMYAPTGLGALLCKEDILKDMPPYQVGGGIVRKVTMEDATFIDGPEKMEAGTPNIADVFGLGAAIEWLDPQLEAFGAHEHELTQAARQQLKAIPGVLVYGPDEDSSSIVSFNLEGVHPHDVGTILDSEGVAVRAGHHCCQPLMRFLNVHATVRASFAAYNTMQEVDTLINAVRKAQEVFA